jgi:thiol-disulfide isomerase/thioredoxin
MRFNYLILLCSAFWYAGHLWGQSDESLLGQPHQLIIEHYGTPLSVLESAQKTILNYPQGRIVLVNDAVISVSGQFDLSTLLSQVNATTAALPESASTAPMANVKVNRGSSPVAKVPSHFRWSELLADAQKRSEASGLPILTLFTGPDWCGPCIQLEKEALGGRQFKEYVRQNFIPLKVALYRRSPQSAASKAQYNMLMAEHQIRGVPSFAILSKEGKLLRRPDIYKQYEGVQNREEHVIAAIKASSATSVGRYLKIGVGLIVLVAVFRFIRN